MQFYHSAGLATSNTLDPPQTSKILLVDDHPLIRKGMYTLISQEADLRVIGEAAEMGDAVRLANELQPDLMVVDISLRSGNGLELVKQIHSSQPHIRMLVCSMHDESLFAERCLRAGAGGYLNKEAASDLVVDAIRSVLAGKTFVSPQLAEKFLNRIVNGGSGEVAPIETLTDRELEVFGLIGQGLTTRQIAERLHLSYKTIESYRENLKAKLSLKNAAELNRHAVQWALENG
ncbi:response regulator [Planctomicrobium sp. SH527]|uniref:response regulator n=1 Tax=Planctomicrobium sp. SH527 TaxID=3448123 RepID=UPI003F5B3C32